MLYEFRQFHYIRTGDLIGNKIVNRIRKFQKLHHKIIQKHLQMNMIKKDIYLQKKDKKLLMIYNIIV